MIYRTILNETSESMCNFRTFYFNIYLFCNFAPDNHLLTQAKQNIQYTHLMKIQYIAILLLICWGSILKCSAQKVAVKTNLFYGAYSGTPNLGVEWGLSPRTTIELGAGLNWFTPNKASSNKKAGALARYNGISYWTCERFSGHFGGIHIIGTQYNIAGHHLPLLFGDNSSHYRYEGWGAGGGISYGYHFLLSNRWSLEANIGAGYVRLHYDKFRCKTCGEKVGTENRNYFGPTKAAISLIFLIK